ncbi:MAG: serine dehydratase [bacterium]|nr:serine dehydratase [bacterium]
MRGPSSSHCAGSLRIGRMLRNLMDNEIQEVLIEYDPGGSLVTTHESQGTDMGLYSGFLGYDTHDERLVNYREEMNESGIRIQVKYVHFDAKHPNTYKITLKNEQRIHHVLALSTGGGMIEFIEIDGAKVCMQGDYYETLVYLSRANTRIVEEISHITTAEEMSYRNGETPFVQISSVQALTRETLVSIHALHDVAYVVTMRPVLPVLSRRNIRVPFSTCEEMLKFNQGKHLPLWELAVEYESTRGNLSKERVFENMRKLFHLLTNSIEIGLRGTDFEDRILPSQSPGFKEKLERKILIESSALNQMIMYVSALMEVKSSMGVIIAAPTAGACGALPGAIIGTGHALGLSEDDMVKAMLATGLIGVFIADKSTFAAESAGCQAECGSASGMAAAGLVHLGGGTLEQSLGAASMALQNSFGMTCDPIANRVEAPCLGKNVMAASNALACANMALADYKHLIPLDEVIQAFDAVGRSISRELRCTALGGLSVTKTAKSLERGLSED